jgi:hypothetical protein
MSWVITAIWMIKEVELNRTWKNVLGSTFAIACGMMTKGPIALLVPVFCFGSDWVLKREWRRIFDYKHLLDAVLIGIFLIPMSIGLYQQFDLHPEIEVNGKVGLSGLKFFYWTQSFGRITGESNWDNGAHFTFLYENMLWAFLPWIILFTMALVLKIVSVVHQRFFINNRQEFITVGGFLMTYLALGMSKYQLPHYIFVVFPLGAIITADFLMKLFEGSYKKLYAILKPTQFVISSLLVIASFFTFFYVFRNDYFIHWLWLWLVLAGLWLLILFHKKIAFKLLWASVAAIMIANVFMSLHFYPQLLKYQVGSQVGRFIKQNLPKKPVGVYVSEDAINSVSFYADMLIPRVDSVHKEDYIITMAKGLDSLKLQQIPYETITSGTYFSVSQLTPAFLNPATRSEVIRTYYLLKIQ